MQSPTEITATTATIHASVDVLWGAQVCGWGAWVEYGSDTGSYEQLEVIGFGGQMNSNTLALPAVTLTGLSPGTSYHYRVDFGQIVDCSHKPSPYYHSYSSASNTFTIAVSPQAGGTYGIASFADARAFIDVPGSRPTVGQNLWLYEGNGTSAQQWSLLNSRARDGYFKIVSGVDGLGLEIRGGSIPDAPIDQYTCDVKRARPAKPTVAAGPAGRRQLPAEVQGRAAAQQRRRHGERHGPRRTHPHRSAHGHPEVELHSSARCDAPRQASEAPHQADALPGHRPPLPSASRDRGRRGQSQDHHPPAQQKYESAIG